MRNAYIFENSATEKKQIIGTFRTSGSSGGGHAKKNTNKVSIPAFRISDEGNTSSNLRAAGYVIGDGLRGLERYSQGAGLKDSVSALRP